LGLDTSAFDTPALGNTPPIVAILSLEMASSPIMSLFTQTGAYLHGHFRLTSGLHSAEYLQCAKVLSYPDFAARLGRELADLIKTIVPNAAIDVVVGPAMGGIVIGHEVARALHARSLFTERDAATNAMTLRRGFEIQPGETAIIIEDVITTGGSTMEVVRVLQAAGANVVAAGSIIDRSGGRADVGVPRVSLQTIEPLTYQPEECPLCSAGQPIVKPGSRRA
jgi:orotate phosphoribosyltransferase